MNAAETGVQERTITGFKDKRIRATRATRDATSCEKRQSLTNRL
jgi:hypothetical protein